MKELEQIDKAMDIIFTVDMDDNLTQAEIEKLDDIWHQLIEVKLSIKNSMAKK